MGKQNKKTKWKLSRQTKRNLLAYSFIAPNFIGFAVFTLIPIVFAFALAFLNWDGSNPIQFAGFQNFIDLFHDTFFFISFKKYNYLLCWYGSINHDCIVGIGNHIKSKGNWQGDFSNYNLLPLSSISCCYNIRLENVVSSNQRTN